jgi:transcriptional regulator with XRE-family HTH domain
MSPPPRPYGTPNEALAAVIRGEQAIRQMSVSDLAEATGINAGTLRRYRTGERQINVDHVVLFAKAFDMNAVDLITLMNARLNDGGTE